MLEINNYQDRFSSERTCGHVNIEDDLSLYCLLCVCL